jgi:hypothetical protein
MGELGIEESTFDHAQAEALKRLEVAIRADEQAHLQTTAQQSNIKFVPSVRSKMPSFGNMWASANKRLITAVVVTFFLSILGTWGAMAAFNAALPSTPVPSGSPTDTATSTASASSTWTSEPSTTVFVTSTIQSSQTPTDTLTNTATIAPNFIPAELATSTPERFGHLKVCMVAGVGVTPGQPFTINVDNSSYSIPAGNLTDNPCIFTHEFPVGTQVTVQELIPTGYIVKQIEVNAEKRVVSKDVSLGNVVVKIRRGEIEIIFTNEMYDLPTSTLTASPTLTPTPATPNTPTPTDTVLPTLTQTITLTPTPEPIDHVLDVKSDRSCKGWEVIVTVSPTNAEVTYDPAQSGKWNKQKDVTVIITASWPDGIILTKTKQIRKPECED